jgi:hypothetical protein
MKSEPTSKPTTKRGRKPKGAGDVIESITEATGIKAAVEWFSEVTGVDCGCDARKAKLNKLFPIKQPHCLEQSEYTFLGTILGKHKLTAVEREEIARIHARTFQHKMIVPCTCSPKLWAGWIRDLQNLYDTYGE